PVGGPNAVDPGAHTEEMQTLEPGRYAVVCLIPGEDGKPHMMKGMARIIEVAGPASAAAPARPADVTITLGDYRFALSTPLTAGTHEIEVQNTGPQPHEVQLVRLAPGKSVTDFLTWLEKPGGPPPASLMG